MDLRPLRGALAAAVVIAALAGCSAHHKPAAAATTPAAVVPSAAPLSSPSAVALAGQLKAGTEAGVRAAIAMPSGQQLDPNAAQQLAALGTISFDLSTFTYIDGQTATVRGHVENPAGEWLFTLTYVSSQWKLVDGRPA
ncbi:hypothetical protein ACQPZX_14500 [Actinoplanes sp. CA-142083]|uniref:hypothetical protein n=1 Tax=Actinoplanes sp. CA-142083 TaxID=3239903 RepID=UPI003D8E4833